MYIHRTFNYIINITYYLQEDDDEACCKGKALIQGWNKTNTIIAIAEIRKNDGLPLEFSLNLHINLLVYIFP